MTPEERVAQLLAYEATVNWHLAFLIVGKAYEGHPERKKHIAAALRRFTLGYIGHALLNGYDGGEEAPRPRNAAEHHVGEIWIGSVLLREFDRLDGIDWWQVSVEIEPLLRDCDRTPPLQREERHEHPPRHP